MISTNFFKIKQNKKLAGVKYSNICLEDKFKNVSKSFYLPDRQYEEGQIYESISSDEFLDIAQKYNLLINEDNPSTLLV